MLAVRDVRREPQRQQRPCSSPSSAAVHDQCVDESRQLASFSQVLLTGKDPCECRGTTSYHGLVTSKSRLYAWGKYRAATNFTRILCTRAMTRFDHRELIKTSRSIFHKHIVRIAGGRNTYAESALMDSAQGGQCRAGSDLAASFDARFLAG